MAESALSVTYTTLRKAIGWEIGANRDPTNWSANTIADVDNVIDEACRRVYQTAILPGERVAHEWSFRKPLTTMTMTAPFTTGTVTIVDGVVTFTDAINGETWVSDDATQAELVIAAGSYAVASYDGANQVTLSDLTIDADALTTFELRRVWYLMPDDFNGVVGVMTYESDTSYWYPIREVSEGEIRKIRQLDVDSSRPYAFATVAKAAVESTSEGQRFRLTFHPMADAAYIVEYRYNKIGVQIDASNPYPLGGELLAQCLHSACLMVANQRLDDGNKPFMKEEYYERLRAAVQADRQQHSPDKLGQNRDPTTVPDTRNYYNARRGQFDILVNGVIPD